MKDLKNRQIVTIDQIDNAYVVDIAIAKTFIEEWDEFVFSLYMRHTGEQKEINHTIKAETDTYIVFQVYVLYSEYINEVIDLSIVRRRGMDEEKRSRIKSNYDNLAFLQTEIGESFVFFPDTTKKGNVSFYFKEKTLLASLEEVLINEESELRLKGFYSYEGLKITNVNQLTLLVTSSLNDEIVEIPVSSLEIPESYIEKKWYERIKNQGFGATIDLKNYFLLGKVQYLKFYLQVEVRTGDGRVESIQSKRLKVNHLHPMNSVTKKIKCHGSKIKVIAKPTAQAKYFTVRIAEYKAIADRINNVKKNWVSLRRSKLVLDVYKTVFYLLGLVTPVNKKLVIFESFHGKQFSDNPRAIYEQMKKDNLGYDLIWSADRRHVSKFANEDVNYVRRFSIRWLLYMTRAKYWVTNARLPLWIPKPKNTIYLQTWHGTPLKRLATDMEEVQMPGTTTERYKKNFTTEASKWDYLVSPNAYSTEIFKRAFKFDKEVIESGYPRNDFLYEDNNEETIARLKHELTIDPSKKVILYAPTWRDNQFYGKGRYKFDLEFDLDQLQAAFGETHVIILRMHYLVAENLNIEAYKGFVYDFSDHKDIGDLYLISDILITDYSSVFFDYANLRRPIIFFVYDIEDYRDNLRGFYFDLEKNAPGPLTMTTEDVIAEINDIEQTGFTPTQAYDDFYDRFCYLEDGEASRRVIERVFKNK